MKRGDNIPSVSDYAHWNEEAESMWYAENRYDMEHWDEEMDDEYDDLDDEDEDEDEDGPLLTLDCEPHDRGSVRLHQVPRHQPEDFGEWDLGGLSEPE